MWIAPGRVQFLGEEEARVAQAGKHVRPAPQSRSSTFPFLSTLPNA